MANSARGVSVVRTVEELEAIGDEWNALSKPFGSPCLDHDWFMSSATTLHRESDLRVVALREGGRLTGVAPLALDRTRGRRLTLLGADRLYEPSGWIYESDGALERLADAVTGLGERIVLQRVATSAPLRQAFASLGRTRTVALARRMPPSAVIDTSGSWDAYCRTLSSRTRARLRSAWQRAGNDVGPPEVVRQQPTSAEVDEALELFMRVEASGWKGSRGSALTVRPDLHAFFREYCRRAASSGALRISRLMFGSTVAAVEIGIEAHRRLWGLKVAYDEQLASLAPALQLVHASIRAAFERRLSAYEFLGVAEAWQQRWKPGYREYQLLIVYPRSSRGVVGGLADLIGFLVRRYRTGGGAHAKTT